MPDQQLRISEREVRILEALAEGADSDELADRIALSKGTIEAEIRKLFSKLGARSRHHLVARAFHLGILPLPRDPRA